MKRWILNGDCANPIADGAPWRHPVTGTNYGPGDGLLRDLPGRQEVVETPEPAGMQSTSCAIEMVNGVPTEVWTSVPFPAPIPPTAAELAAQGQWAIKAQLQELDRKSTRPMAAILAAGGAADPADVTYLADLQAQVVVLRSRLLPSAV